jgi:hypothetical protein
MLAVMFAMPALVMAPGMRVGLGESEFTDELPMMAEPFGM